ncbi:hypothetical protein OQA88_9502 [Cercophora sp. LCS_1]
MAHDEKSLAPSCSDHAITEVTSVEPDWTAEEERKLVRKIDLYLLPALWIMSLLSWMDRAKYAPHITTARFQLTSPSLGNAAIAGLLTDLSLTSSQFSFAIVTYSFGYIAWVPITNIVLSRTRPSIYLPLTMALWGAVTIGLGFVKTYPQLIGLRTLLGAFEASLPVGVTFLFSCWYTGAELGKRSSMFLTSAMVGGAFGSLIAGGVMKNLEGARGIRGWRWLYIVEGIVTVFASVVAMFVLLDYPATSPRLTERERRIAVRRLKVQGIVVEEKGKRISVKKSLVLAFRNWRTYAIAVAASLVSATLVQAYFYPLLVRGLGYTDPVEAQFMTVPLWVVAFFFAAVAGFFCDRKPLWRAISITGLLGLLSVFAIVTCNVYDFKARYVLLAFMTGGVWGGFSQSMAYIAELFQPVPPEVRGITMGVMSFAGHTGSIYGAYLFPAENAPKHLLGFGMVAGSGAVAAIVFFAIWWVDTRPKILAGREKRGHRSNSRSAAPPGGLPMRYEDVTLGDKPMFDDIIDKYQGAMDEPLLDLNNTETLRHDF